MSRRPRPLPRTSSTDIERLKKQRDRLIKHRKSTAIVDRLLCIAVARKIREEIREQAS